MQQNTAKIPTIFMCGLRNIKEDRSCSSANLTEGHKIYHKNTSYFYILFFNKLLSVTQHSSS
jgi:hypothetical protein